MRTAAKLSQCRKYRYALWRKWADGPRVLFVMLNPSTADETVNDPTIVRCIEFATSWGFGSLAVGNLFAYRTPSPALLKIAAEPIGPRNDHWLQKLKTDSTLAIAGWGNHGNHLGRRGAVLKLIPGFHHLGLNQTGEPRHPLYIPGTTQPTAWG